ncbi:mechanosensitive ion channel family protein [Candidatus Endoriftia persephone]|jgi:MscS family membrane protein|uniref:MscS family inner membrane protein YnaI n=3 Tax=Gammaproteobacteria TaxID=1236 RepID=G2FEE8_9GAMM|nr:mechanosensitive ion channel family protein [Candidatus Endoriftia persephone]EGV50431.1 small-conductance mechanosensitive channel [endosymbiont of Riftia pachyptila (vent Ph05)]EGW54918.1 MscS family inner membrane protein YnaI [endosymbiont of Tevnia jerichonana (vent Tica)]USF89104.1 mechanosensitive ion channel family protein [Candidatus Endoriftia persephone]
MESLTEIAAWSSQKGWVVQVFLVIFAALVLDLVQRRLLNRMARTLERTRNPWDDALLHAMRKPLGMLIWTLGITFAAYVVREETGAALFELAEPLRNIGVIFCLAWFLVNFLQQVELRYVEHREAEGREVDHTVIEAVVRLLRASVWITAALVMLQTLGFSVSGVLAFGGIGGIAVGFAAKDLLANFFGGMMIYLDRPFSRGDWIRSPDRKIEGTVEKIGWRLTQIRTFDKRPLYVPNSVFASIAVENPSRMSYRRIYETVGIRYADAGKMRVIIQEIKAMLRAHPEIASDQTLIVNFNEFAPSSLDFFIYTFTKTTDWVHFHEVKEDVLLKVLDIIESQGAEAAFPTSTLHIPDGVVLQQGTREG